MYKTGDLIMYGSTGVCRVSEITTQIFNGEDRRYYVLEPLYQSGVIYAPVENNRVFMRPVISSEEAKGLIGQIAEIQTEIYRNSSMQQMTRFYQSAIDTHNCMELLKLTKSIYEKKKEAQAHNRHLGQIDKKFMKRAEELLYGEFAAALNVSRDEVQEYVRNCLEG